jgi:hypothetical protein
LSYSQELLASARALRGVRPETQATLRRAISTAYYALFHLLIEEACGNWARPEQRPALARVFTHRRMADASRLRVKIWQTATPGSTEFAVRSVASAFWELQQWRHRADYDLSASIDASNVDEVLNLASTAFDTWQSIRNEQLAHDYLFAILFQER